MVLWAYDSRARPCHDKTIVSEYVITSLFYATYNDVGEQMGGGGVYKLRGECKAKCRPPAREEERGQAECGIVSLSIMDPAVMWSRLSLQPLAT